MSAMVSNSSVESDPACEVSAWTSFIQSLGLCEKTDEWRATGRVPSQVVWGAGGCRMWEGGRWSYGFWGDEQG